MSAVAEQISVGVVPDSIEPYVGYKYLQISQDGSLVSPQGSSGWPVGERFEATCGAAAPPKWHAVAPHPHVVTKSAYPQYHSMNQPLTYVAGPPMPEIQLPAGLVWSWEQHRHTHIAPDEHCGCGIYVASTTEGCAGYARPGKVLVQVALWGKVIRGDDGARGQYAYPLRIVAGEVEREWAQKAGEKYGVPLSIVSPKEMMGVEPPRASRRKRPSWKFLAACGLSGAAIGFNLSLVAANSDWLTFGNAASASIAAAAYTFAFCSRKRA